MSKDQKRLPKHANPGVERNQLETWTVAGGEEATWVSAERLSYRLIVVRFLAVSHPWAWSGQLARAHDKRTDRSHFASSGTSQADDPSDAGAEGNDSRETNGICSSSRLHGHIIATTNALLAVQWGDERKRQTDGDLQ